MLSDGTKHRQARLTSVEGVVQPVHARVDLAAHTSESAKPRISDTYEAKEPEEGEEKDQSGQVIRHLLALGD